MAIKLQVEEYCHNCPGFEPDVKKEDEVLTCNDFLNQNQRVIHKRETIVRCKFRKRCECMVDFLHREQKVSG